MKIFYDRKKQGDRYYLNVIDKNKTVSCCKTMKIFIVDTDQKPNYIAIDLSSTTSKKQIPKLEMFEDMGDPFPPINFCPWCSEMIEVEIND